MEDQEEYEIRLLNIMLSKIVCETTQLDSTNDNSEHLVTLYSCAREIIECINEVKYGNQIELEI